MKSNNLQAINVKRLTGTEPFHSNGKPLGPDLLSFWQWSSSDLVGNALRGVLAEYIVACAIGKNTGIRTEWDAYDLETDAGIKVEVKSGAYLQTWEQETFSSIQFGIKSTYGWSSETNLISNVKKRQADVYVFCVLAHKDKASVNPLNLEQWEFYSISTQTLGQHLGEQKTLSLSGLLKLDPVKASFDELGNVINAVATERS